MGVEAILSRKVLRQQLDKVMTTMGAKATERSLAKAIPIAFPIISAVFRVRERQVVQSGLIERYIMEAVRRFGPITAAGIENMLGLEEEIVRRVLQQAMVLGQPITCRKSLYAAQEAIDISAFSCEATHERRFIFNGITGDLLPIAYGQIADGERLFPHDDNCEILDLNGQLTPLRAFLKHGIHDEKETLLKAMGESPGPGRMELGLPHELIDVGEQLFQRRETLWVPAFLLIDITGQSEVRGLNNGGIQLLDNRQASLDWLNKACQRRVSLSIQIDVEAFQKEVAAAFPGIAVGTTDQPNCVRLLGDERAWQPDRFFTTDENIAWLAKAFAQGYWWDCCRGELITLIPGCAHATKTLCLLRAIEGLYRLRSKRAAPEDNRPSRDDWWRDHLNSFLEGLDGGFRKQDFQVSELSRCIDRYPDTSLQEWYEEWV